jgi:hypothetical protein
MRFSIVITALVSAITVSAMPTISSNQPEIVRRASLHPITNPTYIKQLYCNDPSD